MKSIYKIGFLFLIAILLVQCRKDSITESNGSDKITTAENVRMLIQVVNEQHQPVRDASIRLKDHSTIKNSDEHGVSLFKELSIPSIGLLATITHPDYETQYKMINGGSNTNGVTKVMLLKDLHRTTIKAGETGNIDGRGFLTLPEVLEDQKGNVFTGDIKVLSHYFNPDDNDFLTQAPGSLLAKDKDDKIVVLGSLGMYLIELYDATSNTSVNIPEGEKATIKFPVADVHKGDVPSDVPLWSFDEEQGIWIEEGLAQLDGDFMVAEVSHFSFWNCDLPYEFVDVKMTFVDRDEILINQGLMKFFVDGNRQFGEALTDVNGIIKGKLPLNKDILIDLYINQLKVSSKSIGPLVNNEALTIKFDYKPSKIKGNALQCMGSSVEDGYGILVYQQSPGTSVFILDDVGAFDLLTNIGDQTLTLVDPINEKSKEIGITQSQLESGDVELIDVMLCDDASTSSISGSVFVDEDLDGVDDYGLEGVLITISNDTANVTVETMTDANGRYEAKVLPGFYEIDITIPTGYKFRGAGDLSADDSVDEGAYSRQKYINSILQLFEKDTDNNFQLALDEYGSITGSVMIDINGDGLADKGANGVKVLAYDPLSIKSHIALVQQDGSFRLDNVPTSVYSLIVDTFSRATPLFDYDLTPDPDGDDSALGPNDKIELILVGDEIDADNNFVKQINKSSIVCTILEDTNGDGNGDAPLSNQRVELYKRSSTGVPQMPLISKNYSDQFGVLNLLVPEEGEYVLYFIGNGNISNYDILGGVDLVPDNNPTNTTGEKAFLPVDIIGLEYDDGNTFVFREK